MKRHELSEAQWNRVKELLPPERKPQGGRPARSHQEMLNAMVYWLNTGIRWRGSARTVWSLAKCVQSIPCMDKGRRMGEHPEQLDSAGYRRRYNTYAGQHNSQSASASQRR